MPKSVKFWSLFALAFVLGVVTAHLSLRADPRPKRDRDMLDAVAAVQRRAPLFVITEPRPSLNWSKNGSLYLCRRPLTPEDVDRLALPRNFQDARWDGIVCFKGTGDSRSVFMRWVDEEGPCFKYGTFAVFGHPELLQEVRDILAAEGFRTADGL